MDCFFGWNDRRSGPFLQEKARRQKEQKLLSFGLLNPDPANRCLVNHHCAVILTMIITGKVVGR